MVNTGRAENNEVSQSSVVLHNSAGYEVIDQLNNDYGYRRDYKVLSKFGESPDELYVSTLHGSDGSLLFNSGRSPLLGPDRL